MVLHTGALRFLCPQIVLESTVAQRALCPKEILEISKKKNIVIQGDLNPKDLVLGGEKLKAKTLEILEKFKNNKHIFLLSPLRAYSE